jgi:pimeloyl-ACP methyl ester carboxylesterase
MQNLITLFSAAVTLLACSVSIAAPPVAAPDVPAKPSPAVETGEATSRDGLRIAYDDRGTGETTVVFIHGWCGSRSVWKHQLDVFARDYRVIAIDLGGHGASGIERETWTVLGLAHDVRAVIEAADVERAILVGHSMGGPVSVEAARLMPDRVIGVVGIDTMQNAEMQWPEAAAARVVAAFEADYEGSMRVLLGSMIHPDADDAITDWVVAESLETDHAVAMALMSDFPHIDLRELFGAVDIPIRCVNAKAGPGWGQPTLVEQNQQYGDYDATFIDGVGHFPMLEAPDRFNVALRATLASIDES